MVLREDIEKREYQLLSSKGAKAAESRGRERLEDKCPTRTDFQRDRDRIIHSKAFRRLMHKTQVFLAPEGDHYRTRLTHTLEVSQISRTIARILSLNEDLTEAIALGHDLGHTPFGHSGEDILNRLHPPGFKHNIQSLRVVCHLEKIDGRRGMNLTWEVRDGILNHTGKGIPSTMEGQIIRFSDRIAYINHDIDDALRSGVIGEGDLPKDCIKVLGNSHRVRIDTLVKDLTENSWGKDKLTLSEEKNFYVDKLRKFMFENVYHSKKVKRDEELEKIEAIITSLYEHYKKDPQRLPQEKRDMIDIWGTEEVIKDHIAGMTDRYAIKMFKEIYVPKGWE
ncbi:MAG: deoxyguanosinetriphosphate triphosphohydrolase [Anaerovoracaceae bacterium]|jgi:dGTPase